MHCGARRVTRCAREAPMLARRFVDLLLDGWRGVFKQRRTLRRALEHALAITTVAGRRTISRALLVLGRGRVDWTADYRLFSRRPWKTAALFTPVVKHYLQRYPRAHAPIAVALDDTALARAGKHVPHTLWYRDPMSPPFHVNLLHGLRFVQISLIFPHHQEGPYGARSIPVRFAESVPIKKPGKKASRDEIKAYRQARRERNLVVDAGTLLREVRAAFDAQGASHRQLIAGVDGSYCNRGFLDNLPERTDVIARTRKDARLCFPAPPGTRRFYGEQTFTPEQVRQDDSIPYHSAPVCIGGLWREIRYKDVPHVLWQGGARRRRLRLLVLAPIGYKLSPHCRTHYRQPAYLLTTDLTRPACELIQIYVDRWQIEVNHRDEKEILGVGQAQVWSEHSVGRHPSFRVACYSMLLLASLIEFGIPRTHEYLELPCWRKRCPRRASILDMVTRLRVDLEEAPLYDLGLDQIGDNLARVAYG
jgi:hypothetical protein